MYSDADLDAAVEAGALSAEAAGGFRDFIARRQVTVVADEEHIRLITGFNDVFVSIAILLVLVASAWLATRTGPGLGGAVLTTLAWGLAEYFTRKRRMALPSIILLLAFIIGIFWSAIFANDQIIRWGAQIWPKMAASGDTLKAVTASSDTLKSVVIAIWAAVAAAAAWLHWRRFRVPITVAAGVVAGLATIGLLIFSQFPKSGSDLAMPLLLASGLITFAVAMWWDSRDRQRLTRRTDVAFWLHLAAAPMIVHPAFAMLGLTNSGVGGQAVAVIKLITNYDLGPSIAAACAVNIYLILAVAALAVDRRALLVSALAYVFYALRTLFQAASTDTSGATAALAALVIGSGLLLLSAFWQRARRPVVELLPAAIQARVPPVA